MPIYEFKCLECGHEFEEFMKFAKQARMISSGEIWPLCEKCCGKTKKVMSSSNFKVNGSNAANGYS
jgi:putative FmdB family regulatory protein